MAGKMCPAGNFVMVDAENQTGGQLRGKGKGGLFFAVDRALWPQLWTLETANRLNFVTAYLVLLAGTGSDHQLTKWSAKACEEHVGMGKPRAMRAIEELVQHGIITRTENSTRMRPQYRFPPLDRDADPIFLPVQLVTGLKQETPVLRRVRETGDALLLRMLVDLYGLIETDATYGVPITSLRENPPDHHPARKLFESGANTVWAMELGNQRAAQGEWTTVHRINAADQDEAWAPFWERVALLAKMGALWFEPWIFDGDALDAEPLMPVDPSFHYAVRETDRIAGLTRLAYEASAELAGERTYFLDRAEGDILVPFPGHHRAPEIRGVAKLRVEPDTPGHRIAYARRMRLIEGYSEAFATLRNDAANGRLDRPLRMNSP
ncbi:hypothetical protein GGQ88_003816 [Novosphingobium hassiacum]|uniref:Uncharacterized protein n=1 Tax=Novosphingobium hassiacum TaxID=173676 RepID=A0A7W6A3C3_9SPHN|nr:hypothetical protein [Novosphingobium hassiacum]MBB3862515.1 hypothetical protein [Novosphingobium hassiacum]